MIDTNAATTKKTQAAKTEIETVKKPRKPKEFKSTHYVVFPLENNDGIYRVKWGAETHQTELVEASSALEAAQKTNHPPKLGEGFASFVASLEKMISGSLTVVRFDSKKKEYEVIFESSKPKTVAVNDVAN